ncbi:MAG: lipocalin-like domain-containing protein [Dehalococcoidia bacterium]|nr:lipocalin-like domain-containing protein [Dehalococcoidia bacterium]
MADFVQGSSCAVKPSSAAGSAHNPGLWERFRDRYRLGRYKLLPADPAKSLALPEDHRGHTDAQWEWWYFNGHLETASGRRFDYFWSFFKVIMDDDTFLGLPVRWFTKPFYVPFFFGGASLLDRGRRKYAFGVRGTLPFFWMAHCSKDDLDLRLFDYKARREKDDTFRIRSSVRGKTLDLQLKPVRPPILHGYKGRGVLDFPKARHSYYSLPRLDTAGTIKAGRKVEKVTGISWMDHQYGFIYSDKFKGWDWMCVHLANGADLVFSQVTLFSGDVLPQSCGAVAYPDGRTVLLSKREFVLRPLRYWKSRLTRITYAVDWEMEVPTMETRLRSRAHVDGQQMIVWPMIFWEGSNLVSGLFEGKETSGRGFLETFGDYNPFGRGIYKTGMLR